MEPVAAPDDGTADGDAPEDGAAAGAYKTRDLVDRVAKVAGVKRRVAKPLVEAVLTELSAALHGGRTLSLRPLGKVTVSRMREDGGGHVLVCRIRQRGPGAAATKSDETPDPALAAVDKGR
jgi:DNA-binding protein HU-alpha